MHTAGKLKFAGGETTKQLHETSLVRGAIYQGDNGKVEQMEYNVKRDFTNAGENLDGDLHYKFTVPTQGPHIHRHSSRSSACGDLPTLHSLLL